MGIYGKASELVDTLQVAIARGEPIVDLAPQLMTTGLELMRQGSHLMDRVVRALDELERLSSTGTEALGKLEGFALSQRELTLAQIEVARLQARKLELEIAQLERR